MIKLITKHVLKGILQLEIQAFYYGKTRVVHIQKDFQLFDVDKIFSQEKINLK